MEIKLIRFSAGDQSTLGLLTVNGFFICYTLEDEKRPIEAKVKGKTRIPRGIYRIVYRNFGRHYGNYVKRFPWHKGMLELQDVPGFTDILIHIGNYDEDTSGCILIGDGQVQNVSSKGRLLSSTEAYEKIYRIISSRLDKGERVYIEIIDEDWIERV